MTKSQRKLAEESDVSQMTIERAKKSLGIETETISEEDAERIKQAVSETADLKRQTKLRTNYTSNEYDPDVRRIDQSDDSSVLDMLHAAGSAKINGLFQAVFCLKRDPQH